MVTKKQGKDTLIKKIIELLRTNGRVCLFCLALAALIWAIAGYRRDPKDYRFARWAAIGAVIANAIVWLVLLAGFALFVPVERTVEGTSEPVEVESSAVHAER